jgi:gas vesicle protein
MATNGASKFSILLIGLGLGAIGGLMATILGRKETREVLRESGGKSLDYINQQAGKLRETADEIVQQGKKLIGGKGADPEGRAAEAAKQVYQEERRENLGG